MDADEVRRAFKKDGYCCIDDPTVGSHIQKMEEQGFQFTTSTIEGWEFCENDILNNPVVRGFIESNYQISCMGYFCRIAEDPGHVFQFRNGSNGPDILLVQLWGRGHKAVYFPGSHLISPRSYRAANRLWEVVQAELTRAGINGREKSFMEGGLAILDARLCLEMPTGAPITAGFVGANDSKPVDEELARWPKLELPTLASQYHRSASESRIGVHVAQEEVVH